MELTLPQGLDLTKIIGAVQIAAKAAGINSTEDVIKLVIAFVQALPSIERGVASAAPFIEAFIEMTKNGGAPTPAMWDRINAALSDGSKTLEDIVASDAQAQDTLIP